MFRPGVARSMTISEASLVIAMGPFRLSLARIGAQANRRQKLIAMVRDMPSRRANDVAIAIFGVR
jgi:hypothetical protein